MPSRFWSPFFGSGFTVSVTTSGSGAVSWNWRSDGSPARAAASTWYQPGIAQSVSRVQPSSDRRADQVTATSVLTLLRITTSSVGIARGHWRLDQMSSSPDVIFTVSDSGETRQVQAAERMVRSSSTKVTGLPPTVFFARGVTAMSRSTQSPSGSASSGPRLRSPLSSLRGFLSGLVPSPGSS